MDRLEELLKLKEEIEAEIEAIQEQDVIDETLDSITEDLLEELAEADEDTCIHCLVKKYLSTAWNEAYDIGYEDAILNIEE